MPIITQQTIINVPNKDNVEYRISAGSAMRIIKVRVFASMPQVQAYVEKYDMSIEPMWLYQDEFEEVVEDAKRRLAALKNA